MGPPRVARDQQGQTSAEYVGVLAFVAAVVALMVMSASDIGATVVDKVQEAICTVTGGECGDGVAVAEGGENGGEVSATDPDSGEGGEGDTSGDSDDEGDPDDAEADPDIVEDATEDIRDALGGFWGVDYGDIADTLEGLDPAEFNAVIANLDDAELALILAGMGEGFFGTDEDGRRAFFNAIAAKASPETLERIMALSDDRTLVSTTSRTTGWTTRTTRISPVTSSSEETTTIPFIRATLTSRAWATATCSHRWPRSPSRTRN
ncbi:hypothetical protein BH20ACT23_BH20ACT23_18990 [soil metagenome]